MADVLVVDDDVVVRVLLRALLEAAGHAVEEAVDGAQGLARLLASAGALMPDVVMVDSRMPGVGGVEVVRRLRQEAATAALPIVLMSGADTSADVDEGLGAGADTYLVKPFSPATVLAALRTARDARPAAAG